MPPGRSARAKAGARSSRGPEQNVGEQQIGLRTPQRRMRKPVRLDHADARLNAVHTSIFGGDGDGDWIHVARHHTRIERPGGGDGEDAGAGADIEDAARMRAAWRGGRAR